MILKQTLQREIGLKSETSFRHSFLGGIALCTLWSSESGETHLVD